MSINSSEENSFRTPSLSRRALLRGATAVAMSVPLQNLMIKKAQAAGPIVSPYGAIVPTADENTGLNLIQLPPGFKYWSFGWTGDPMKDGTPTPGLHDGMAVVKTTPNGRKVTLVRNHELGAGTPFAPGHLVYSAGAGGGTTNLVWDTKTKRLDKAWSTLSGTVRNCSGGLTTWNSWITSEETFSTTTSGGVTKKHGYNFDIPAGGGGANNAKPIIGMGRFSHEGCCIDPTTNYIYETEDGPSVGGDTGSGFYRFIPTVYLPNGRPNLRKGGLLQMLRIVGTPQMNMQFLTATDPPTVYDTTWVNIDNPDPTGQPSCFTQGLNKGGASFRRLEGVFYGLGKIYFTSTDGGPLVPPNNVGEGQVWEYDPVNEKLKIIYHSAHQADCENPDNICVTPNGALLLQEDNSGGTANDGERLLGLTLSGDIFTFAKNNLNFTGGGLGSYIRPESGIVYNTDLRQNEWAGACFSDDGKYLFVNNQTPGITFAITGPWENGPF